MTLERYAEIRAEMETGRLRDDVLKRIGITVDEWAAAQRKWLKMMGNELALGKFELTNRYTQTFLARQRALQENAKQDIAPAVEPPAGVKKALPTALDGTLDLAQGMQIAMLARQILPFGPSASSEVPVAPVNEPRLDETQGPIAVLGPVTPFADSALVIASNPLSETIVVDALQGSGRLPTSALPFDPSAYSSLEDAFLAEQPALTIAKEMGATLDIFEVLQRGTSIAGATPFEKPKLDNPEAPVLTLERYASLCVDYAAAPTRAPEIAQRYGLTREQWVSVDAFWRGKMASDPAVKAAWEKACVGYGEWLRRK